MAFPGSAGILPAYCRLEGGATSRQSKETNVAGHGTRSGAGGPPEGHQKNGALALGVRREESHHVVVVKGETRSAQALRVGGQVESPAQNACFQLNGPIAAVSETLKNGAQVGEEKHRCAAVGSALPAGHSGEHLSFRVWRVGRSLWNLNTKPSSVERRMANKGYCQIGEHQTFAATGQIARHVGRYPEIDLV